MRLPFGLVGALVAPLVAGELQPAHLLSGLHQQSPGDHQTGHVLGLSAGAARAHHEAAAGGHELPGQRAQQQS